MPKRNAFSLIELSIVLVILGLLVGGVLAGQSLIAAAELRKMGGIIESLRISTNTFRMKYNALAGDMNNAYTMFGASCAASAPECNGDGNGKTGMFNDWSTNEGINYYKHMSLAGLSIGTAGTYATGMSSWMPGTDIPAYSALGIDFGLWPTTMDNGGYAPGEGKRDPAYLSMVEGNYAGLFRHSNVSNSRAYEFDMKYDDGKAGQGRVRAYLQNSGVGYEYDPTDNNYGAYPSPNIGAWLFFSLNN